MNIFLGSIAIIAVIIAVFTSIVSFKKDVKFGVYVAKAMAKLLGIVLAVLVVVKYLFS